MEASYHSWLQCTIITNDNKLSQVKNTKYIVGGVVLYKRIKRGALQRASQAHDGANIVQLQSPKLWVGGGQAQES